MDKWALEIIHFGLHHQDSLLCLPHSSFPALFRVVEYTGAVTLHKAHE